MFNYFAIPGSTNAKDIEVIELLAKQVPENGTIVEIGSWAGRSAVAWARNAHPSVRIYCIDLFPDKVEFNTKNMPKNKGIIDIVEKKGTLRLWDLFRTVTKNYPNIIPLRGRCPEEITYDEPIDLLFLDAQHNNPNDWDIISHHLPLIKPNGILCGHDHYPRFPAVMENVNRLKDMLNKEPELYEDSSMWKFTI